MGLGEQRQRVAVASYAGGGLGFAEGGGCYRDTYAIVPLKQTVNGMKVRIDGRTFVNYAQFESGIVVPNYVAGQADLPYKAYVAKDSMICNFA